MKLTPSVPLVASVALSLLLMVMTSGCGNSVDPSAGEFSGILMTYEDGRIAGTIGDASDDWQPIPAIGAELRIAAPNPATTMTKIVFAVSQQDSVRLWLASAPGKLDTVIYHQRVPMAGTYAITTNMAGKAVGIYRAYLTVYRDGNSYTTYGDIKKE